MLFEPRGLATAIGSLPHTEVEPACELMLESLPEAPVWPQLPRISYVENMYVQFSEGMPGIKIDLESERVWFETGEGLEENLEEFYTHIIDDDLDYFAISEKYARGLKYFLDGADLSGKVIVKGQVTGPISFGLTVTDQNKRCSIYNETLAQALVKALGAKGRWQAKELKKQAPDSLVLMFCDEPYLASVGSALVSVSPEQVTGSISECMEGWGDLTGIHCCGNTDWSLIFATGVDVVNFDAYYYLEKFIAYRSEIVAHLRKGGMIAWGIVPNDDEVMKVSARELAETVEGAMKELASEEMEEADVFKASMITPSCGIKISSVEVAEKCLALCGEVSERLREKYL